MWTTSRTSSTKPHLMETLWLGCGAAGMKVRSLPHPTLHPTHMIPAPIHVNLTCVHLTKLIYIIVIIYVVFCFFVCLFVLCVCVCVFSWTSESYMYLLGVVSNNTRWTFIPSALWGQKSTLWEYFNTGEHKGVPLQCSYCKCVCVCVCVCNLCEAGTHTRIFSV